MSTTLIKSPTEETEVSLPPKAALPLKWKIVVISVTYSCALGNYWSLGIITALKPTIERQLNINDSHFTTLVTVTTLINTILSVIVGCLIDKFGGPLLLVILVSFYSAGTILQVGTATENINSYSLFVAARVIATLGQSSMEIAQHRIFAAYFAPGKGFAVTMSITGSLFSLFHFVGQTTVNAIAKEHHSYSRTLWISAFLSFWSFLSSVAVVALNKCLRVHYDVVDQAKEVESEWCEKGPKFGWHVIRQLPFTFWTVTLFAVHQNAGLAAFVSLSKQYAQQRLGKDVVVGDWVSRFNLLLPIFMMPFEGIFIDMFGHRITLLFTSAVLFLISITLLRFSDTIQTFTCAYVFYAISLCFSAPQVELVRNIIPDPQFYATASAIKNSVVQASAVIIVTMVGMVQETSQTHSLEGPLTVWLYCGLVSVCLAAVLYAACETKWGRRELPTLRLSQVKPHDVQQEVERLWAMRGAQKQGSVKEEGSADYLGFPWRQKEFILKNPMPGKVSSRSRACALGGGALSILGAWVMFGIGIVWGLHATTIELMT